MGEQQVEVDLIKLYALFTTHLVVVVAEFDLHLWLR